jgi:hypothetical protein
VRTPPPPPIKLSPEWGSKRMARLDGRQVKCCTYDPGEVWIHTLDNLPSLVRRRLADARYNICPTCVDIDTRNNGGADAQALLRRDRGNRACARPGGKTIHVATEGEP